MPNGQERNHQWQAWCHGFMSDCPLCFVLAWDCRPDYTYKAWAQEATASDPDHPETKNIRLCNVAWWNMDEYGGMVCWER